MVIVSLFGGLVVAGALLATLKNIWKSDKTLSLR